MKAYQIILAIPGLGGGRLIWSRYLHRAIERLVALLIG